MKLDKLDLKIILACTIILLLLQPIITKMTDRNYLYPESVTKPTPKASSNWETWGNISCYNFQGERVCINMNRIVAPTKQEPITSNQYYHIGFTDCLKSVDASKTINISKDN